MNEKNQINLKNNNKDLIDWYKLPSLSGLLRQFDRSKNQA